MAGNAIVGTLRALLTLDTAEFESGIRKVPGELKKIERDFKRWGQQASDAGRALTAGLTLPIVGVAGAAVAARSQFEDSFAGILKTVGDATDEFGNMTDVGRQLSDGMRALSLELPVNVNELNRIGEAAGQLGVKSEHILQFTEVMAKLGMTTVLTSEQAAESLAQFAAVTEMPLENIDRLGSAIVALGNDSKTNEAKIVDFGLRIAGSGAIAGLAEAEILGIGAAMASVGIEAEAGGTAVQKVLLSMTEAVATGNKDLQVFAVTAGMSAAQFAEAFRTDAAGAFTAFVEGLKVAGTDSFKILEDLRLGNDRVIRSFLSLSGAGGVLRKQIDLGNRSFEENIALNKEAEQRARTFTSQVTLLWSHLKDLGYELGDVLLPIMRDLVDIARTHLVPLLKATVGWFTSLSAGAQTFVVAAGALVAALGPVLWGFGQLLQSGAAIIGLFKSAGVVLSFTVGLKALAIAAAVAGAAFAAWKIVEWIDPTGEGRTTIKQLTLRLGEYLGVLKQGTEAQFLIDEAARRLAATNEEGAESQDTFTAAMDRAAGAVKQAFDDITSLLDSGREWSSSAYDAATATQELSGQLLDLSGITTRKVVPSLQDAWAESNQFIRALGEADEWQRQNTGAALVLSKTLEDELQVKLAETTQAVTDFAGAFQHLPPAANEAADRVKAVWSDTGKQLAGVVQRALEGGGNVWESMGSFIGTKLANTFTESILMKTGDVAGKVVARFSGLFGQAMSFAMPVIGSLLGSVVGPLIGMIGNAFKSEEERVVSPKRDLFVAQFGSVEALHVGLRDAQIKLGQSFAQAEAFASGLIAGLNSARTESAFGVHQRRIVEALMKADLGAADIMQIHHDIRPAIQQFATGGMVKGATDTVPAWLSPGEFVVSTRGVQAAGMLALDALNSARASSWMGTQEATGREREGVRDVHVHVAIGGVLDSGSVAEIFDRDIVPRLVRSIRQNSFGLQSAMAHSLGAR